VLEIVVHEIRGYCPVYKVGDRIVIDDPEIVLEKTDALCTHALSTLLHYALILEHDWCPVELGLTTAEDEDNAYMQCVDLGKPYTEGGTVIFKCSHLNRTTRLHKINTEETKMKDMKE
jgi:uncharacterized repeat protein (TIGR04076 family)